MPRYFVTTSDGFQATDEAGIELPDIAALETMLRRTLADILHDEGRVDGPNEFWAEAMDEKGWPVLKLKVTLSRIGELKGPSAKHA